MCRLLILLIVLSAAAKPAISLAPITAGLKELAAGKCFYCRGLVKKAQVDHFIPWVRYPNNAIENLVLAHSRCNNDKRDHLVAATHVGNWVQRLLKNGRP